MVILTGVDPTVGAINKESPPLFQRMLEEQAAYEQEKLEHAN
jgi:hypothetical protein